MNFRYATVLILPALLGGCAVSGKMVTVRDQHGLPIKGVQVISQLEGINAGTNVTDSYGHCTVNMSRFAMGGTPKYLAFVKEGYQTEVVDFPSVWPFTMMLKSTEKPKAAPASLPADNRRQGQGPAPAGGAGQ